MADYIEKIKNLLDLAGSDNEHEARAALLKARELMAKHKINEKDMESTGSRDVLRLITDISYSQRRDPWTYPLAAVIATHHCCRTLQTRAKRCQVAEIGFIGFEEDVLICRDVFRYAVDCVRSVTNKWRRTQSVQAADGYGYGFVLGLNEAYEKQSNEEGWGLMPVVPKEVDEAMGSMRQIRVSMDKLRNADISAYAKGVSDGRKFDMARRIAGKEG